MLHILLVDVDLIMKDWSFRYRQAGEETSQDDMTTSGSLCSRPGLARLLQ